MKALVLKQYNNLLRVLDATPLSALEDRSCSKCFSQATLDTIEKVKMMKDLQFCSRCGRILYMPALLGAAEAE